jgi:SAM-dependent methyltransferase
MEPQTYVQLAAVEDRHWWHRSREGLAAHYIRRMALPASAAILDVGCGTGGTTRFLQRFGRVTGVDLSPLAVQHARAKAPQATIVEGDANDLGQRFARASFDLVTLFNVLYHRWVRNDADMLRQIHALLRPGGWLLITDAAHRILMRAHDALGMGKTRYALADFRQYFRETGFHYIRGQYFNAPALPICLLLALKHKWFGSRASQAGDQIAELNVPPAFINRTMLLYMSVENWLFSRLPLSVGVTLLVVGRKV